MGEIRHTSYQLYLGECGGGLSQFPSFGNPTWAEARVVPPILWFGRGRVWTEFYNLYFILVGL